MTYAFTGESQTQFWLSLCGVSGSCWAQGLFEPSQGSLVGMGFDSKCDFNSPTHSSFWGFSFALEHGVSFFGGIKHSPVNARSAPSV